MKFTKTHIENIILQMSSKNILVIGDAMIDEYIWGTVTRISPEAPVPIVNVDKTTRRLGGSANVIQNLASLGISSSIASVCGDDESASVLRDDLHAIDCNTTALIPCNMRQTSIKTRIMAHQQQIVRVDREHCMPLTNTELALLVNAITKIIPTVDGIIISDYDKGVVTPELFDRILPLCKKQGIFVAVDPKKKHFQHYSSVDVITPNLKEAYEALGRPFSHIPENINEIVTCGWELTKQYKLRYLLLTLSEKGMMLFDSDAQTYTHLPTVAREVYDVTGAGDTVISVFVAAIVAGASPVEATYIANHAAGITVAEIGTASVTPNELITAIHSAPNHET